MRSLIFGIFWGKKILLTKGLEDLRLKSCYPIIKSDQYGSTIGHRIDYNELRGPGRLSE